MSSPTDATLAAYQAAFELYCAASGGNVGPADGLLLDALVDGVPTAGHVLEIGCGPGHAAQYLEERGLQVDRTDGTPAFVALLHAQGHQARVLDVRTDPLGGPYAAVLANAVLLHLDRDDAERALVACHAATRDGGLLALSLKEGDGEAWSSAKLDRRRWFVYWREPALREVLERSGWTVRWLQKHQGRYDPWLIALCVRQPAPPAAAR